MFNSHATVFKYFCIFCARTFRKHGKNWNVLKTRFEKLRIYTFASGGDDIDVDALGNCIISFEPSQINKLSSTFVLCYPRETWFKRYCAAVSLLRYILANSLHWALSLFWRKDNFTYNSADVYYLCGWPQFLCWARWNSPLNVVKVTYRFKRFSRGLQYRNSVAQVWSGDWPIAKA